jgi:hypothetical protein
LIFVIARLETALIRKEFAMKNMVGWGLGWLLATSTLSAGLAEDTAERARALLAQAESVPAAEAVPMLEQALEILDNAGAEDGNSWLALDPTREKVAVKWLESLAASADGVKLAAAAGEVERRHPLIGAWVQARRVAAVARNEDTAEWDQALASQGEAEARHRANYVGFWEGDKWKNLDLDRILTVTEAYQGAKAGAPLLMRWLRAETWSRKSEKLEAGQALVEFAEAVGADYPLSTIARRSRQEVMDWALAVAGKWDDKSQALAFTDRVLKLQREANEQQRWLRLAEEDKREALLSQKAKLAAALGDEAKLAEAVGELKYWFPTADVTLEAAALMPGATEAQAALARQKEARAVLDDLVKRLKGQLGATGERPKLWEFPDWAEFLAVAEFYRDVPASAGTLVSFGLYLKGHRYRYDDQARDCLNLGLELLSPSFGWIGIRGAEVLVEDRLTSGDKDDNVLSTVDLCTKLLTNDPRRIGQVDAYHHRVMARGRTGIDPVVDSADLSTANALLATVPREAVGSATHDLTRAHLNFWLATNAKSLGHTEEALRWVGETESVLVRVADPRYRKIRDNHLLRVKIVAERIERKIYPPGN